MSRKKLEEASASASSQILAMTESRDRLSKLLADCQADLTDTRDQLSMRSRQLDETMANNAELKERVAHQTVTIATLRGYVERVKEDDVVREELVTTGAVGDPCGETQIVPKRKHAILPEDYISPPRSTPMGYADHQRERTPRKHWVNY